MAVGISRGSFGRLASCEEVEIVTLQGRDGFEASIITYGATLQALRVPDRQGRVADILLGHDDLAGYVDHRGFFGATIGRYANRIAGGRFELDGETFEVEPNDGPNALHGGAGGFDRHLWTIDGIGDGETPFVMLSRHSADGEGGFPGALDVRVTYRLRANALEIDLRAVNGDRPTIVNLTNHAYFNLGGALDPV